MNLPTNQELLDDGHVIIAYITARYNTFEYIDDVLNAKGYKFQKMESSGMRKKFMIENYDKILYHNYRDIKYHIDGIEQIEYVTKKIYDNLPNLY
jgi:hypothetical protein